jgi:hypothetical protein
VVERTPAWLTGFRRLTIRDERREDIHLEQRAEWWAASMRKNNGNDNDIGHAR